MNLEAANDFDFLAQTITNYLSALRKLGVKIQALLLKILRNGGMWLLKDFVINKEVCPS